MRDASIIHSNALLHLGYDVSRSHAAAGSLKTNASRAVVHDILRVWIEQHPVRMDKIDERSPARKLLAHERQCVFFSLPWRFDCV